MNMQLISTLFTKVRKLWSFGKDIRTVKVYLFQNYKSLKITRI